MNDSVASGPLGIAFTCNRTGEILTLIRDDLGLTNSERKKLSELVDSLSAEKASNFLKALLREGTSIGWELNALVNKRLVPILFNGGPSGEDFLVVGATTLNEMTRLTEALMAINNEQTTALRAALKDLSLQHRARSNPDSELFDELSRLNNELVTLQRDLARKNHELEKLNRLKDAFLGMASHDLRKPVSGILMSAQMLAETDDHPLGEDQKRLTASVKVACHKIIKQLNDFLDIAQIETGKLRVVREPTDLRALLHNRLRFHLEAAKAKRIDLQCHTADDLPLLLLDADRVEQVIDNLVENALKYSPAGERVEVRLARNAGKAVFSVTDHGAGLNEEQILHLFEPFKTAGTKTTGAEKSTGLGLAIVKAIVSEHDGTVSVQSEPGKGATFRVALPLDE